MKELERTRDLSEWGLGVPKIRNVKTLIFFNIVAIFLLITLL